MLIAQKYGNEIFKLGGVQSSLHSRMYDKQDANKKDGEVQHDVEWKDARVEWERGEESLLRRWVDGRTGVP